MDPRGYPTNPKGDYHTTPTTQLRTPANPSAAFSGGLPGPTLPPSSLASPNLVFSLPLASSIPKALVDAANAAAANLKQNQQTPPIPAGSGAPSVKPEEPLTDGPIVPVPPSLRCPISFCPELFFRDLDLVEHLELVHQQYLCCGFMENGCFKLFDSSEDRLEHIMFDKPSSAPICPHCCVETRDANELENHKSRHSLPVYCPFPGCPWRFPQQNSMVEHWRRWHPQARLSHFIGTNAAAKLEKKAEEDEEEEGEDEEPSRFKALECQSCSLKFLTPYDFDEHMIRNHQQYYCLHCGHLSNSQSSRAAHITSVLSKLPPDQRLYPCYVCCKGFGKRSGLSQHKHVHALVFGCSGCSGRFSRVKYWRNHQCSGGAAKGNDPIRVITRAHDREVYLFNPNLSRSAPPSRALGVPTTPAASRGFGSHHSQPNQFTPASAPAVKPKEYVPPADFVATLLPIAVPPVKMEPIKASPRNPFPAKCGFKQEGSDQACEFLAQSSETLDEHCRLAHSKFGCWLCLEFFSSSEDRDAHYYNKLHDNKWPNLKMIPYRCQMCCKSYANTSSLQQHHGIHTLPFTCPACDRRFAQLHPLKEHVRSSHPQLPEPTVRDFPYHNRAPHAKEAREPSPSSGNHGALSSAASVDSGADQCIAPNALNAFALGSSASSNSASRLPSYYFSSSFNIPAHPGKTVRFWLQLDTDDEASDNECAAWNALEPQFSRSSPPCDYVRKSEFSGECLQEGCDFLAVNGEELEFHLVSAHKQFVCLKCKKLFPTDDARAEHFEKVLNAVKQSHESETPGAEPEFISCASCCQCGTEQEIEEHGAVHSLPFECQFCGDRFSRYSHLKEHRKTAHVRGSRRSLAPAARNNSNRGKSRGRGRGRGRGGNFRMGGRDRDSDEDGEGGESSNDEETWIAQQKSTVSQRRASGRPDSYGGGSSHYEPNKRRRTASYVPNCCFPGCNVTAPNGIEMDKHFQEAHHNWLCLDCYSYYPSHELRQAHYSTERKSNAWVEDFPCEYCCRSFDTNLRHFTHMKTHLLEIKCPHCEKRFSHVSNMKAHLSTNHKAGGGPAPGAGRGRKRRRSTKFSDSDEADDFDDDDMMD